MRAGNRSPNCRRSLARRVLRDITLAPLLDGGQNDRMSDFARPTGDRTTGRMYVFLLILGAVIAAAGIVLVAAGVPIQGHEFDASVMTPGAVAIVGGLILIGLGLAVR